MTKNSMTSALVFLCLWWTGCSTQQSVSASFLFLDPSKSVTLFLRDGSTVSLRAGEYTAVDTGDSCYVRGSGRITKQGAYQQEPYSGTVNFLEIKELRFYETPSGWQTAPFLVMGSILVALAVFFSTANFKT